MTLEEIKRNAPDGATHYYKNQFICSYFFYSNEVNLWFVWSKHYKYWSSAIFKERIAELHPL